MPGTVSDLLDSARRAAANQAAARQAGHDAAIAAGNAMPAPPPVPPGTGEPTEPAGAG